MRLGNALPFAALGVLILVVSTAAVFSSMQGGTTGPIAQPSAAPVGATPRAVPELSRTARIAYWREGRLWVSGLDGSLRRSLAPIDEPRRVSHMRWSPDGDKIAFLDAGLNLVVIRVDGLRWDVSLPLVLRDQGWRIADLRWSPDSFRIATTFLRPADGRTDAFVTGLVTSGLPTWTRVTQLNDLFVGDWVSETEILVSTGGGVIGLLEIPLASSEASHLRPISGALGASPILASDGRVHFLAGRVPTARDPTNAYITASRASVWSAALDGSDVRRETLDELNDVRLDARLADGRYLVHRGGASVQSVTGTEIESLPTNAGLIRRVRVSPDGRTAYGFTNERIVTLDVSKVGLPAPASPEPSASVFLDSGGDADVWFPAERVAAQRGLERQLMEPAARYVFALGGHLWHMGPDGKADLLRAGQSVRRTFIPTPRWSPAGKQVLALEQAGFGAPTTALIAVLIDGDFFPSVDGDFEGDQLRLGDTYAAARSFAWAPDGSELAIVVDKRGVNGTATNAQLEVRFLDTAGQKSRAPISGTEVAWTSAGILVMDELSDEAVLRLVDDAGIEKIFARRDEIMKVAHVRATPWLAGAWSGLDASPDGSWTSVRITTADGSEGYYVLMDRGGTPVDFLPSETLSDASWSRAKPLLGYTANVRTVNEHAVVHDPGIGSVAFEEGRFAGWSPDGEWYFVAKSTGLFAYPLAGGTASRVGPVGVPAAITAPD